MESFGKDKISTRSKVIIFSSAFVGIKHSHSHLVHGERTRLVDAEKGCGAEVLDRRRLSSQYISLRDAPRTEGQKNQQDRRQFVRQDRHGESQTSQKTVEPIMASQPI